MTNKLCVLIFQFTDLGFVTSVQVNHKPVESARKGQEVCVKIEPVPGEAPKMFGRHFDEHDMLVSKVRILLIIQIITIFVQWNLLFFEIFNIFNKQMWE